MRELGDVENKLIAGWREDENHGGMNMGRQSGKREALECTEGMGRRSYGGRGRWW